LVLVAEAVVSGVHGVDAWLLDAGGCSLVAGLIHGCLKLFEEAVNLMEIILSSGVWQWKLVAMRSQICDATTSRHVVSAGK
jgi:hypothetical protein